MKISNFLPPAINFKGKDKVPEMPVFTKKEFEAMLPEDKVLIGSKDYYYDILQNTIYMDAFFASVSDMSSTIRKLPLATSESIVKTAFKDVKDREIGDYICKKLKENHIDTAGQLVNFAKEYKKTKANYFMYEWDTPKAIEIYGGLKEKSDLSNYPVLLLNACHEAKNQNQEFDPNTYTQFLKKLGCSSEKSFLKNFWYLSQIFGGYESINDYYDSFKNLFDSYGEKEEFLKEFISKNPNLKKSTPEKIYSKYPEYLDFFYINHPEDWREKFSHVAPKLFEGKILTSALNRLEEDNKNYNLPKFDVDSVAGLVKLFEYEIKENLCASDINELSKRKIISDLPFKMILQKRQSALKNIMRTQETDEKGASEYYLKYKELINVAALAGDDDIQLDKIIKNFDIKDDADFMAKCRMIGFFDKSEPRITIDKAVSCLKLMSFADEKTANNFIRKRNFNLLAILRTRKQEYENIKNYIEGYLKGAPIEFGALNPHDIYMRSVELNENAPNRKNVIANMFLFNTFDDVDYEQKLQTFKIFKSYFENDEAAVAFIKNNNIKSDDKKYVNLCERVLKLLYDPENREESLKYISQLTVNPLIKNSKDEISDFMEKSNKPADILKTALDNNDTSLDSLNLLISNFSDIDGNYDNLIEYAKSNNLSFKELYSMLENLDRAILEIDLPYSIDDSNISKISFDKKYIKDELNTNDINTVLKSILDAKEDENFISKLPFAYTTRPKSYYTTQIVSDIVEHFDTYPNLTKMLGIDKKSFKMNQNDNSQENFQTVLNKITPEFYSFVNSSDWVKFDDEKAVPNVSMHTKLRAIERFILNDAKSLDELYTDKSREKLRKIFKTLYSQAPQSVLAGKQSGKFTAYFTVDDINIKAAFTKTGNLITIVNTDF